MLPSQNLQVCPVIAEYDKALRNAKATVYDSDIRDGELHMDSTGPLYYNDAKVGSRWVCVYRVSKWMVKCLIGKPPQDIHERYLSIDDYIRRHEGPLSFLVPHKWIDKAIKIDGRDWPFIKSDYVEHVPLGVFLQQHYKASGLISELARHWHHIISTMESLEMAHGDLDVTNVLVCGSPPNVTLHLIDFDSMYVPALAGPGRKLWEQGHEHFQPIENGVREFNKEMDRFSALVIYLSLIAIAEDGTLWETCKANEESKLILGANDFEKLGISPAYQQLRAKQNNEDLQKCLDELASSIQAKHMPRSLPEILSTPRRFEPPRPIEALDPDMELGPDDLTETHSSLPPLSFRLPEERDIPLPLSYIKAPTPGPQPPPSSPPVPRKSRAAIWWWLVVLGATILIAYSYSAQAPGLWVIPVIVLVILIVVASNQGR